MTFSTLLAAIKPLLVTHWSNRFIILPHDCNILGYMTQNDTNISIEDQLEPEIYRRAIKA